MKIAYLGLGLAMCFVVVSGVNIWLLRRRREGRPALRIERLWVASVWGVPLAIAVSALAYLGLQVQPTLVFWLAMALSVILGGLLKDKQRLSQCLRGSLAGASMLLVFLHLLRFGSDALNPASLPVNLLWLGLATAMIWSLLPFSFGGRRQVAGQAVGD